jgi:hypothetical protein
MRTWFRNCVVALAMCALAVPGAGIAQSSPPADKAFSQAELDQMLAPIALYPDALLAQVLMASTYPLEVVGAARWVKANPKVTGKALEEAMKKQSWDPAVKSLTAFPTVLAMMTDKIEWTQQLGDAFLGQRAEVMNSVQALRQKAYAQGNLKSTEQQKVVVEKESIVIQPASTSVVYVPVYNPTVVYGAWWYPAYVPYYWYPPGYVAAPGLAFTTGVVVGAALWGGVNWRGNDVNINVNHYNQFNHTKITNASWQHNAAHRKGVAYRDPTVAQRYNRNQALDAANRAVNKQRAGNAMSDRANAPAARDGAAAARPSARDVQERPGRAPRDRPGLDNDGPDRPDRPDRPGRPGRG